VRTFLALFPQKVVILIKTKNHFVRAREIEFLLAYRTLEQSKLKEKWSRHLEDFNNVFFVNTDDPTKQNPFNPFKRVIKLANIDESMAVHHIITAFESQHHDDFEKHVYFCMVKGMAEDYIFIPNTAARVADVLVALRAVDYESDRKIEKETKYSKTSSKEAADDAHIIRR
jgi:hypothetical protein